MTVAERLAEARSHYEAGRLRDAEQLYRQILQGDAENAEALYRLGVLLLRQREPEAAIASLQHALRLRPGSAEVSKNLRSARAARECMLGNASVEQRKFDDAAACFRRALQLAPRNVDALNGLALALVELDQADEAMAYCQRAIELEPDNAEALNYRGLALEKQNLLDQAEACYRQALTLKPEYIEAIHNLGVAQLKQSRLADSVASFRQALALKLDHAEALNHLGVALAEQDLLDQAIDSHRRATLSKPELVNAHYNLALALMKQNKYDQAEACYDRVLKLQPDDAAAHVGRGMALLARGQMTEGWQEYEWRLKVPSAPRPLAEPRWTGAPLAGRTILLCAEQGAGDALQFIRYASLVKQQGANVIAACPPSLARLLASCPGVDSVFTSGQPAPRFDVHAWLASLPGILARRSTPFRPRFLI